MSLDHTAQQWLSHVAGATRLSRRLTYGLAEVLPILLGACWALAVLTVQPLQQHKDWYAVVLVGAVFARFGIVGVISQFVRRERPFLLDHLDPIVHPLTKGSFPSGHAVVLAYAAVVYCSVAPAFFPAWFAGLCAVAAISRIAADVHYPSDVIAGGVVGASSAYIVLHFFA